MSYEPDPTTTDLDARAAGKCGYLKKDGQPCRLQAGHGTAHLGQGCCKKHGGNGGRPPVHGRYSKVKSPRLLELIAEFKDDPDPLNLLPDIALLRGLIMQLVEKSEETPLAVDLVAVARLVNDIGALADRVHKREQSDAFTEPAVMWLLDQYGEAVLYAGMEHITDANMRAAFGRDVQARWDRIPIRRRLPGESRRVEAGQAMEG